MNTLQHADTEIIQTPIFPQGAPKIAIDSFDTLRRDLRMVLPKDGRVRLTTDISTAGTSLELVFFGAQESDARITFNNQTQRFEASGEMRMLPRVVIETLKNSVENANSLLEEKKALVGGIQGTTRDAVTHTALVLSTTERREVNPMHGTMATA